MLVADADEVVVDDELVEASCEALLLVLLNLLFRFAVVLDLGTTSSWTEIAINLRLLFLSIPGLLVSCLQRRLLRLLLKLLPPPPLHPIPPPKTRPILS